MRIGKFGAASLAAALCFACGGDDGGGSGTLQVQLEAEASISDGLELGGDEENSRDFAVTFSKYLVAIGRVKLGRTGQAERSDARVFVADMLKVGERADLFELPDLASGRWEQLAYETPITPADAVPVAGASAADVALMAEKQVTYWIEGTVARPGNPVRFSLQVAAPATFSQCQTDARPGVAIPEDARTSVSLTLHGDHLFFDAFLTGSEATVVRKAQWIVSAADALGKTEVVTADLAGLPTERVLAGYATGGGPYGPINSVLDFVRSQLATQGHVNGEGECVTNAQ